MAKKKLRIDGFLKALKVSISTLWEHRKIKKFHFPTAKSPNIKSWNDYTKRYWWKMLKKKKKIRKSLKRQNHLACKIRYVVWKKKLILFLSQAIFKILAILFIVNCYVWTDIFWTNFNATCLPKCIVFSIIF